MPGNTLSHDVETITERAGAFLKLCNYSFWKIDKVKLIGDNWFVRADVGVMKIYYRHISINDKSGKVVKFGP